MPKSPKSLAELFAAHESAKQKAKILYDEADRILAKLVRLWKKDKKAPIDPAHYLEIDDLFRGQTKAFAPGFAHRYKLRIRNLAEQD